MALRPNRAVGDPFGNEVGLGSRQTRTDRGHPEAILVAADAIQQRARLRVSRNYDGARIAAFEGLVAPIQAQAAHLLRRAVAGVTPLVEDRFDLRREIRRRKAGNQDESKGRKEP